MKMHLGFILTTFLVSINCLESDNISRLHADMDYIRTNFDRSLRLLESVVQSQSAFNASLARLEQRHDSLNASLTELSQSVAGLQRSHDATDASLAAMEQSDHASCTRVEQTLLTIDCVSHGNHSHATTTRGVSESFTSVVQPVSTTTSSVITANCFTDCLDYRTRGHHQWHHHD